jgi:hypothetical protein
MSLESLWDEIVYTEASMLSDENAADIAAIFTELAERSMKTRSGQLLAWREEIVAQAHISQRNYRLDRLTERLHRVLVRTQEDAGVKETTSSPLYKSYIPEPVSRLVGRGLESQLSKCRDWPTRLARESEPQLKELAPFFEEAIQKGQAALDMMTKASGERKSHRTREIIGLFEDANNQRKLASNQLSTRGIERKLSSDWSDSFFRTEAAIEDDPLESKQRAILQMLSARGVVVSKEERGKILAMSEAPTLERWCAQVGVILEVSEVFV